MTRSLQFAGLPVEVRNGESEKTRRVGEEKPRVGVAAGPQQSAKCKGDTPRSLWLTTRHDRICLLIEAEITMRNSSGAVQWWQCSEGG
jgi:hypothetical protein